MNVDIWKADGVQEVIVYVTKGFSFPITQTSPHPRGLEQEPISCPSARLARGVDGPASTALVDGGGTLAVGRCGWTSWLFTGGQGLSF